MKKLLFGITILAVAVLAQAQRGGMMMGGGAAGNPVMILGREDVQEDLKLTDDQKEKLADYTDMQKMFPKMMSAAQEAGISREDMRSEKGQKFFKDYQEKIRKEIEGILTPDQAKRWNEIAIQMAGNMAVARPEIAKLVGLTDDQNAKIKDLQKKQGEAMQGLIQQMRDGELTREDLQEKMKKNNEILDSEVGKLLTEPQKAKLKELGGKHFEKKDDN